MNPPVDLPGVETIEAARVDAIRRKVVDRLNLFIDKLRSAETRSIRQTVADLFQLFESFGVRKLLAQWIDEATAAGEIEQRGEHEQVWAELIELLDQDGARPDDRPADPEYRARVVEADGNLDAARAQPGIALRKSELPRCVAR